MRRISGAFIVTLLCVYLLFNYRTSLGAGELIAARGAARVGVVSAPRTTTASTSKATRHRRTASAKRRRTASPSSAAKSTSSRTRAATARVVVNGAPISMQYGVVQIRIVAEGGKIVSATALSAPSSNGRDQAINGQAIPILDREVVQAGSANVDAVSGATYTSNAYRQSVQAAIDAAHLKS